MRIAIYETVHLDWVLPLCSLFAARQDSVFFFSDSSFRKDLEEVLGDDFERFHWTFSGPEDSLAGYFEKLRRFFRQENFDLVLLNSVDSRHLLLYLAIRHVKSAVLINIHDVNSFFSSGFSIGLRSMARAAGKSLLRKRSNGFIVNARSMKVYIESREMTDKPVYWLPPVISMATLPPAPSGCIRLTIPGSVDRKRRDYLPALEAVAAVHQNYPGKLCLNLAGRPVGGYGRQVLAAAENLRSRGLPVFTSDVEISEAEFQNMIAGSDILLSPLTESMMMEGKIMEHYGMSKCSGNIYDAIRHGRPLVLPRYIPVPEEIESSCLFYSNLDGLRKLLENLVTDPPALQGLVAEARKNSEKFSFSRVSGILHQILENSCYTSSN